MKKFLRFSISGYVAITYAILLALPLINFSALPEGVGVSALHLVLLSMIGAGGIPLGFVLHEISVAFLGPLRNRRFGQVRAIYSETQKNCSTADGLRDYEVQDALEAAKGRVLGASDSPVDWEHLVDELSGRCNYFYARVEAAILAPLVAVLLLVYAGALIGLNDLAYMISFSPGRLAGFALTMVAILIGSTLLLSYIPRLAREIDALELRIYEGAWGSRLITEEGSPETHDSPVDSGQDEVAN